MRRAVLETNRRRVNITTIATTIATAVVTINIISSIVKFIIVSINKNIIPE
jgi:hypothetical protein